MEEQEGETSRVLTTAALEIRCEPRCGGRISHFIPRPGGQNQFHWDPPQMDPRQLSGFVPIGGWNDMILSGDIRFPGLHWNQPFRFERIEEAGGPSASMQCEAGGLQVTRTITVLEGKAAVTVATEYRNVSGKPLPGIHIRTQPILRPGGKRTPDTAVLWPSAHGLDMLTLKDSLRGAGRYASHERKAATNWWACCDPDARATLLIEDSDACAVAQNLYQDSNLLILENIGATADLQPGEVRRMEITLHYYPHDLSAWAGKLGGSRFLSSLNLLIGVRVADPELSVGEDSLTVDLTCIALGKEPPFQNGTLALLDAEGHLLRNWSVRLDRQVHASLSLGGSCHPERSEGSPASSTAAEIPRCARNDTERASCACDSTDPCPPGGDAANARMAEAVMVLDLGSLAVGRYALTFAPTDGDGAASITLRVVEQTRRQKQDLIRQELAGLLDQCEEQVTALDAAGFVGAMVRHDLDAAQCFLRGDRLDLARQYVGFIRDALDGVQQDAPVVHPDPRDLRVPEDWFRAMEGSLPELPALSRHADHYGTFHDKELMNGWRHRDDAQTAFALAWLYFHPASRYRGQNEALCRAVLAVDDVCRSFADGSLPRDIATDRNINRFTLCPLGDALRILFQLPLAPARKEFWRTQYRKAAEHQIETYGGRAIPEGGYLNQDVMYLLVMRFAHEFLGDSRYLGQCSYILDMMESQLLPDGAFYYIYPHNEVTIYHELNIAYLYRDWMLSGEPRSRALIEKSARYYPLMVSAEGWVEFSSQTWWKHTGGRWPLLGPTIVAGVTGDGQNQYIASRAPKGPFEVSWFTGVTYAALAARDDVKPEPLPERQLVLDRNVQGPRGRFGPFSWVGSTAPYRDTLVGCLVDEPAKNRAYVMHYAGPQVLFGSKDEANPYLGGVGLAMSPQDYERAVVIRANRAVLSARYGLFPYEHELDKTRESDWLCEQLWYFDDERLVGLMCLTADRESEARAVDLSVRFADYDAVWQKAGTDFAKTGDRVYAAGPLVLRVLEHNLDAEAVRDTWVCAYTRDTPGKGFYARTCSTAGRFSQGSRFHLLVEVRPATSDAARIIRLSKGCGFQVESGENKVVVRMSHCGLPFQCELGGV